MKGEVKNTKAGVIKRIEALYERLQKAKKLVEENKVRKVAGAEAWVVENGRGEFYLVANDSCTCPDFQNRRDLHGGWCKHRLAVEILKERGDAPRDPDIPEGAPDWAVKKIVEKKKKLQKAKEEWEKPEETGEDVWVCSCGWKNKKHYLDCEFCGEPRPDKEGA